MKRKLLTFFGHHEYIIFIVAVVILAAMYVAAFLWEFDLIPPLKYAKITFAIFAESIGGGCAWIWMNVIPDTKKDIDPDTPEPKFDMKKLTEWQKIKYYLLRKLIGLAWYFLFFFGFLWLIAF